MSQFQTLVWREWRQNRRGWITLMSLPSLLLLALIVWAAVQGQQSVQFGRHAVEVTPPSLVLMGLVASLLMLQGMVVTAGLVVQAGGLARRDRQDRSIEFWQAMPVSDTKSVLATLATHWLLWPLAAAWATLGLGLVVGALGVLVDGGPAALARVAWGPCLDALWHTGLRFTAGYPMALLWLSPVILAIMAMSAWFGRWGFPGLIMAAVGLQVWLKVQHGSRWVIDVLKGLMDRALLSVVPGDEPTQLVSLIKGTVDRVEALPSSMAQTVEQSLPAAAAAYKQWIWQSMDTSLAQLQSGWALAVALVSLSLVASMVLRRSPRRLVAMRWIPSSLLKATGH